VVGTQRFTESRKAHCYFYVPYASFDDETRGLSLKNSSLLLSGFPSEFRLSFNCENPHDVCPQCSTALNFFHFNIHLELQKFGFKIPQKIPIEKLFLVPNETFPMSKLQTSSSDDDVYVALISHETISLLYSHFPSF
jgi:hypothetical protein